MRRLRILKKPYNGLLYSENCKYKYIVQREVSIFGLHLFWKDVDWHFNEGRAVEILNSLVNGSKGVENEKMRSECEVVTTREVE